MIKSIFNCTQCLYLLLLLVVSCSQQKPDTAIVEKGIDSVAVSSDTVIIPEAPFNDSFYNAVRKFSKDHPNYKSSSPQFVDTLHDLSDHWFLMSLVRHRKRLRQLDNPNSVNQLKKLPTVLEVGLVSSIRQGAFYCSNPKNKEVVFEEWNFNNQEHAEHWLVLLSDSLTRNEYTKPPRFQWVEGARLYLVSTRSASQWFEFSDSLVMRLSGKTIQHLSRLYDPLDLKHFKKWQGPANSSVINTVPYLFQQNSGPHYSYFYFVKHRLTGETRAQANNEFLSKKAFSITTSLHEPLTGSEQFNSILETLAAVQCSISEPALSHLDVVGKTFNEMEALFGTMLYERGTIKVFGHSNRIIVAKMDPEKVTTFKYLRLKEPFETLLINEDMLTAILSFE